MSEIDYTAYVAHARRVTKRSQEAVARHEAAWTAAYRIADFLRKEYAPTRIIAFGSLVHPETFGLHSDIDIAVEGIEWLNYLRAWSAVDTLIPEFDVDLVDLSIASPLLLKRVEEGVEI